MQFTYLDFTFTVEGNEQGCRLRYEDTSKFFEKNRWFEQEEMMDAIFESGLLEYFEQWFKNKFNKQSVFSFPFEVQPR